MTALVLGLVLFIGLPALALRYGVDSRGCSNGWRPPCDWRERDPRR
jgi:hypothetical protein